MSEIKPVAEVRNDGGIIYLSGALAIGSKLYGAEAVQQLQREKANIAAALEMHDRIENETNAENEKLRAELAAARQQLAEAEERVKSKGIIPNISAKALREAADIVSCGDDDDEHREVCILWRDAFVSSDGEVMPAGHYCYDPEYPEEGLHGPLGIDAARTAQAATEGEL